MTDHMMSKITQEGSSQSVRKKKIGVAVAFDLKPTSDLSKRSEGGCYKHRNLVCMVRKHKKRKVMQSSSASRTLLSLVLFFMLA